MNMQSPDGREPARADASRVDLSKWINERCPEWTTLLTDHEVARLTRRPRCLLPALAFFGRLPAPRRYHGKKLGWHRQDIERWLAGRRKRTSNGNRKEVCWARIQRQRTFGRARAIGRPRWIDWEDRHG